MVAVALAFALVIWLVVAFLGSDATVRADGQAHQVSVGTDGDRMLWLDDDTTCSVVDRATGDPITLRPVRGYFERPDSNSDLVGLYKFDPGSGDLEVTCVQAAHSRDDDDDLVLIGPVLKFETIGLAVLLVIVIPGILGLAGLIVLIVTGILFATRDPRPKQA